MTESNYSRQKAQGYMDRLALKKRHQMFKIFNDNFPPHHIEQVLDVGVTADKSALSSNYFEKYFPDKHKIIALSNQDGEFLTELYPGLKFKQGDACALPFADQSIDVVFSSAVIEHIGNYDQQKQMVSECYRVSKQGVFITTPNRWHPLEVHTMLPLIHWLPKRYHRQILTLFGLHFYAQEHHLNLLDKKFLKKICRELSINNVTIKHIKAFGFTSNLLLILRK